MKPIKLKNNNNPKILIRAANWIGDAIMTTPVIRALKKNYPDSHISILAKPWVIPVFDNNPYIDEIILFDDKKTHKKGFGFLRLAKDLRKYKFDISILMPNSFSSALITFFAGITQRVGYNTDAIGFKKSLEPLLKKHHKTALILGTGGASKAIGYVLENLGIESQKVSRKPTSNQISYQEINQQTIKDFTIII